MMMGAPLLKCERATFATSQAQSMLLEEALNEGRSRNDGEDLDTTVE
jgi:hypothetical protein